MTPKQALDLLDAIVSRVALTRADNKNVEDAVSILRYVVQSGKESKKQKK